MNYFRKYQKYKNKYILSRNEKGMSNDLKTFIWKFSAGYIPCTLFATATSVEEARELLVHQFRDIESQFEGKVPGDDDNLDGVLHSAEFEPGFLHDAGPFSTSLAKIIILAKKDAAHLYIEEYEGKNDYKIYKFRTLEELINNNEPEVKPAIRAGFISHLDG